MWIYIENWKDKRSLEIGHLSVSHSTYKAIFFFHPCIKIIHFWFNHLCLFLSPQWSHVIISWPGHPEHNCFQLSVLILPPLIVCDWKSESCSVVSDSLWPRGLYSPWNSSGQNVGVGSCSLLQRTFLTQGWNPGLPQCRWILFQLSHKGSPSILEWVAYPFPRGSSRPRNWTTVSHIAGRCFTTWAIREAHWNDVKN